MRFVIVVEVEASRYCSNISITANFEAYCTLTSLLDDQGKLPRVMLRREPPALAA
jgi:hypothetical protein